MKFINKANRLSALSLKEVLFFGSLYFLLGLWYTYPLMNYINQGIPFTRYAEDPVVNLIQGDHLEIYYNSWLLKDNLLSGRNPFANPYPFNYGREKTFHPQITLLSFLMLLSSPLGAIASYNLWVLLSFPLAGLAAFLLVHCHTGDRWAALIGGLIFSLAPHRYAQLGGHTTGFLFFLVPLAVFFLEKALQRGSVSYGVGSGLAVFFLAWSEYHLFYYLMLFLGAYLPLRVLQQVLPEVGIDFAQGWKKINRLIGCRRLRPYHLLPLSAGLAGGLPALLISSQWLGYYSPLLWLIPPCLALACWFCWRVYAALLASLLALRPAKILRADALSYASFYILLLYLYRYIQDIPQLGRLVFFLFLALFLFTKTYWLLKQARNLRLSSPRPGLWGGYRRALLPFSFFLLLALSYVIAVKVLIFDSSLAKAGRGLGEIALYSPGFRDMFIRFNENSEKFIYLGIVPLLLVGYLLYRLWVQRRDEPAAARAGRTFLPLFYLAVLIISYLLTLGPNLRTVPLYFLFYKVVPFFNFPRVTARIIVLSFLALAVLAGFAVYRLRASLKDKRAWASTAVLLLAVGIVVDFYPAKTLGVSLLNHGNAVYDTIQKNIRDQELVLELPLWPGDSSWSSLYQYYVTRYRYRMINGYSPVVPKTYVEQVFDPLYPLDFGHLGPSEYAVLQKFNVRYIVMHEEAFPEKVSPFPPCFTTRNLSNSPYLRAVQHSGSLFLFEVRPGIGEIKPTAPTSSVLATVFEAERLPRRVGKLMVDPQGSGYYSLFLERKDPRAPLIRDPLAPAGNVVFADRETDPPGLLNFGPYRSYPAGRYAAVFRLRTADNSSGEPVARLEVSAQNGRMLLAAREIQGRDFTTPDRYQDFPLLFTQERPQKLEFKTYFYSKADLRLDAIVVSFADQAAPASIFEGEDLWRKVGITVADPAAVNGLAVVGRTTLDPPGYLVSGPYRTYPPGSYRVTFRLKARAPEGSQPRTNDMRTVAVLDITADFGRLLLARHELTGAELHPLGSYIEFPLTVQVDVPRELEFRVQYEKILDLWLDRVRIVEQPAP